MVCVQNSAIARVRGGLGDRLEGALGPPLDPGMFTAAFVFWSRGWLGGNDRLAVQFCRLNFDLFNGGHGAQLPFRGCMRVS